MENYLNGEINLHDVKLFLKETFCRNTDREFAGALLRPHPWSIDSMPEDIVRASKEAGYQLIREGKMLPENLAIISRPLISLAEFVKL